MPYADEFSWYADSRGPSAGPDEHDRLTHLVLVDGRLVDVWSEPATGTRWQEHADRFDRERRPMAPPAPPPPPPHEQVARWLRAVCGGSVAVAELDTAPLTGEGLDLPRDLSDVRASQRLEATAALLDAVTDRWFDAEVGHACRRALLLTWESDPDAVRAATSPAHLAGGVCWAVGKANELFRGAGGLTQTQVRDALALTGNISSQGGVVQRALRGFGEFGAEAGMSYAGRALGVPDLLPLGHVGLLTSRTRLRLVRLRDRAAAARAAAA